MCHQTLSTSKLLVVTRNRHTLMMSTNVSPRNKYTYSYIYVCVKVCVMIA